MGLFGLFASKKKGKQENGKPIVKSQRDLKKSETIYVKFSSNKERILYIKDHCEMISEYDRQIEEAKMEYQAVTSYLTDMQKITMIPEVQRDVIEEAAKKIIQLTEERSKFQKKNMTISDKQYRLLEGHELQIPRELTAIKESEEYQGTIQKDMEHLEEEKIALEQQEEDVISKQSFLKGFAITITLVIVVLFALFALINYYTDSILTLPFLLTVLMGMACALYITMEARRNQGDYQLIQRKQNRQIMLMNKVTIKAVNNQNYLDYMYNKYMVENYKQLKENWEEYVQIKEEAKKYESNTRLLEYYNNELIKELKKFQIVDAEIWIYQPSAIIDPREMVEVRHRLNVRRQKLRERMDMISKQKEEAASTIQSIIETYPECKEDAYYLLNQYKIEFDLFEKPLTE